VQPDRIYAFKKSDRIYEAQSESDFVELLHKLFYCCLHALIPEDDCLEVAHHWLFQGGRGLDD
jgi:hypothetical protein